MGKDADALQNSVRLFTDGGCSGNPGPGGWAFILEHPASGKSRDASGAEPETTNNRMELMGVIEGLASLNEPCQVELVTDSQYVAKGISEWLPKWKRQGWQRKEKGQLKPVANVDLWQRSTHCWHPQSPGHPRAGPSRASGKRGLRPHGGRRVQGTCGGPEGQASLRVLMTAASTPYVD